MKNPNAFAAAVAGGIVTGVQWLLGTYAHTKLSLYWSGLLDTSAISLVLLIGRDGVWGAVKRGLVFLKSGFSGTAGKAASK